MTKAELLLDTLKYYSADINRRCKSRGGCWYSPLKAGKVRSSKGCAIGRHLKPTVQHLFDACKNTSIDAVLQEKKSYKKRLPTWMQKLSIDFLVEIQSLHDTDHNWTSYGLSPSGKDKVFFIMKDYSIRKTTAFKKYLPKYNPTCV